MLKLMDQKISTMLHSKMLLNDVLHIFDYDMTTICIILEQKNKNKKPHMFRVPHPTIIYWWNLDFFRLSGKYIVLCIFKMDKCFFPEKKNMRAYPTCT